MTSTKNLLFLNLLTLIFMLLCLTGVSAQELVWSPDGSLLASGNEDGTVRVWQPSAGRAPLYILKGHTNAIRGLAWSPNGHTLASLSYDGTICLWDSNTGQQITTLINTDAGPKKRRRRSNPFTSAVPVTVTIEEVSIPINDWEETTGVRLRVDSSLRKDVVVRILRESEERYWVQGKTASGRPTRENKVGPRDQQESYVLISNRTGVSEVIPFSCGPYESVDITILPLPYPPPNFL